MKLQARGKVSMLKTLVGVHPFPVIAAKEIQMALPIIAQFSAYQICFII